MSVSDPLIKELKGWTRKLMEIGKEITDDTEELTSLCVILEKCFQKGLFIKQNPVGFIKKYDAWNWLEEIGEQRDNFTISFNLSIESVLCNPKVQTNNGKLRLLIRTCLTKNCLHIPVQLLVRTPGYSRDFYDENSILGDEILGEIFLSVLLQIDKLKFKLHLNNSSFLDDSWLLPEYKLFELVPCKTLGISVCFVRSKALVVNVQENSVAAEDDKVEIGDVLDEINDLIFTSNNRGKLGATMKKSSGLPIKLRVIKFRSKSSSNFYGPIVNLIQQSGVERLKKILQPDKTPSKIKNDKNQGEEIKELGLLREKKKLDDDDNSGYRVTYCGFISTGTEGDVKQIEQATLRLLRSDVVKSVKVKFECLEIGIKITELSDDTVILKPNYMDISSCGRSANIPNYFAFIAGETRCNMATKFNAYIFHHKKENEIQTILQSLGQGFYRTHCAV